jgi:hypothetical protein
MYDINTYRDSPVVSDPILHLSLHFDPLVVSRGLVECHDWPVVAPWIDVIITFCDFCQFSANKMAIISKTNIITYSAQLVVFSVNNANVFETLLTIF